MKKFQRILLLAIIFMVMIFNLNFVKGVDLNLTENITNSYAENVEEEDTATNTTTSTSKRNSTSSDSSTLATSSATVKTTSSTEAGLGISNVLNILLISVGILLILLAIAILIRLKK